MRACAVRAFAVSCAAAVLFVGASRPPAAADVSGTTVDGIRCQTMEMNGFHIHQHLAIFDRGRPVLVPSDVGRPFAAQCLYWLHTHTPDGIIHIEAPAARTFTLGSFFDVWGQPLTRRAAASARVGRGESMHVWVDGSAYAGDPRAIPLAQHTDITIEVGPPYTRPRPFTDWNGN